MSASALSLLAAALAGAGLGGLYMALLWAAVRRLPREPSAASGRSGVASFVWLGLARVALLLGALAVAAALALPAEGFVAALAGFVAVRFAATRVARRPARRPAPGDAAWK